MGTNAPYVLYTAATAERLQNLNHARGTWRRPLTARSAGGPARRTARPIDLGYAVPPGVAAMEPAPLDAEAEAETALENWNTTSKALPATTAAAREPRMRHHGLPGQRPGTIRSADKVSLYSALITWQWNPLACMS